MREGGRRRQISRAGPQSPTPNLQGAVLTPERPHLDSALARGLAWTGAAKAASQFLAWASTLLVARLLLPQDYGIATMASLLFWASQSLGEFGLGAALIRGRELPEETIAQVNSASLLFGLAGMALVCAVAGPVSVFFATPELQNVILVSSVTLLISGFRIVPSALLQRDLQFRRLGFNDTVQAAAQAAGVLLLALLHFGYWSLVLGNLIGALVGLAGLLLARRHRFSRPRADTIRGITIFGRDVTVSRFAWYAMFNADFVVAGRVLGKGPLGSYSFAWTLASLPVEKISMLVTRVSFPFFSAVQHDRAALRRYLLGMTEGLALVTFPAAIGIGLLAGEVVRIALGPQWAPAILPLRVLAIVAPIRSVATLLPQMSAVLGRTRFGMYHALISALVMTGCFVVGSRWGVVGIAAAWVVAYPLVLWPLLQMVLHTLETPLSAYLRALRPAVTASVLMSAAVLGTRLLLPLALGDGLRSGVAVLVGAGSYALALWILDRDRVLATYRFVRSARNR
jgi:O-antigen/teichoic acid export membrane protein